MAYEPPVHRRSCLGLIVAPIVAIIIFAIGVALSEPAYLDDRFDSAFLFLTFGSFLGAFPAAVLLGFPIYFALRGRMRATPLLCGAVGAAIGIVPAMAWRLNAIPGAILLAMVAGLFGGISFWLIAGREVNQDLQSRKN